MKDEETRERVAEARSVAVEMIGESEYTRVERAILWRLVSEGVAMRPDTWGELLGIKTEAEAPSPPSEEATP